jgi:hypothetical protein
MERICTHCHAIIAPDSPVTRCPACNGEWVERPSFPDTRTDPPQIDHRGILLPRRHALGGIITPQ